MTKLFLLTILTVSVSFQTQAKAKNSVQCSSFDEAVAAAEKGTVTSKTLALVALCQIEKSDLRQNLCETRIGLRKDILKITEAEFNAGQVDESAFIAAQVELEKTSNTCLDLVK